MTDDDKEQNVFTLTEAADFLRLHPRTIRREIDRGNLTAARLGRVWRITRADINTYLREHGSIGLGLEDSEAEGTG